MDAPSLGLQNILGICGSPTRMMSLGGLFDNENMLLGSIGNSPEGMALGGPMDSPDAILAAILVGAASPEGAAAAEGATTAM